MDADPELRDFDNTCRLFPLPGVVMLPHSVLPLHIFEPRYRQMTEDALAGDRLIAIVQVKPQARPEPDEEPEIEPYACLGRIVTHERLPDGRFKLLLLGCKRVRLTRELPGDRLYRRAEVEVVEDREPADPTAQKAELAALFREVFELRNALNPDLEALLEGDVTLGKLSDLVGHALNLPASLKQMLLADPDVSRRAITLIEILRQLVEKLRGVSRPDRIFPPPFSVN